jgi:hypothetical protein
MSWFSDLLSSITGSNSAQATTALAAQVTAQGKQDTALDAQRAANARLDAAAVPAIDSDAAHLAGEAQQRKMLAAMGLRFSGQPIGAAPLGYTTLTGQ